MTNNTVLAASSAAVTSTLGLVTTTATSIGQVVNSGGHLANALEAKADAYATGVIHKAKLDKAMATTKAEMLFELEYVKYQSEKQAAIKSYGTEGKKLLTEAQAIIHRINNPTSTE